jgi:hypothetical protein
VLLGLAVVSVTIGSLYWFQLLQREAFPEHITDMVDRFDTTDAVVPQGASFYGYYRVTQSTPLHRSPSSQSEVQHYVASGDFVFVLEKTDERFYRVSIADLEGYVSAEYLHGAALFENWAGYEKMRASFAEDMDRIVYQVFQDRTYNPQNESHNMMLIHAFMTNLMLKDYVRVAAAVNGTSPGAYRFIQDVSIEDYEIVSAVEDDFHSTVYRLRITVSESKSEYFQVGTSYWFIRTHWDSAGVDLFIPAGISERFTGFLPSTPRSDFAYAVSHSIGILNSVSDFDAYIAEKKNNEGFLHDLLHFYEFYLLLMDQIYADFSYNTMYFRPGGISSLKNAVNRATGITGLDFTNYSSYDSLEDLVPLCTHGGWWIYYKLLGEFFDPATNRYTVLLNFYADRAFFCVARTLSYTIQINADGSFTIVEIDLLYQSGYGIRSDGM